MIKKKLLLLWLLAPMLSIAFSKAAPVNVSFNFCENAGTLTRNLSLTANAWETKELCLEFYTDSIEPVEIEYLFPRGILSKEQLLICRTDPTDDNDFGKMIEKNGERKFIISAKDWKKIIKEKINIPLWMSWMIYWCFVYEGAWVTKKEGQMFDIAYRKTANINIFVWGSESIVSSIKLLPNKWGEFSSNKKIKATLDKDNKLNLSFLVENVGNIEQEISLKWSIHNALWFEKEFEIPVQKMATNTKSEFSTNIWMIPTYKWVFNVEVNINAQPSFSFDTTNIDENLKQAKITQEVAQVFIFSRIWIIALLFAILIIWLIIRPLFKKHTNNV